MLQYLYVGYDEIFNKLDRDSTGTIPRDDLIVALRLAGHNPTKDDIQQLLQDKEGKKSAFMYQC